MAEIVQSLFGITPESYRATQQQQADAQALQYAKLDPFQQANFAIGRGASMLGGAIGGALGGQDPELQRITMRQQIARQLNPNEPASIQQGITALSEAGDSQGAMMLQAEYRKLVESNALVAQRGAAARASDAAATRERTQATPEKIQLAKEVALLSGEPGSPQYNTAYAESLKAQIDGKPPAPNIKEVGVSEKGNLPVYFDSNTNEQFTIATGADGKPVRKPYVGGVDRTTAKTTNLIPGQAVAPKDWMDFTQNVLSKDPVMQRTSTILSDAPSAIEIIRTSTSNDISAASLPGALARLTGEGKNMSNQDVNRFARTGGLDDRLAGDAVKFFTGKATNVKKDQAEKFATALYRGALLERKKKLTDEAEQFGYLESPNYKSALQQIDSKLSQFKLAPKPGAASNAPPAQAGKLSDAELLKKYGAREQ
jgi:hypothetical protein